VLITGASSGIGRALAKELHGAGATLMLASRSGDKLNDVRNELDGVQVATADITNPDDRQRLIDTTERELGGLDLLVNNAGVAGSGHFATSNEDLMRQTMETNFFAPGEMSRAAMPVLMRGKEPCILNVASMCGRRGVPAWPEYSASKFALVGITEAMRAEFVRFDVDILLMIPGLVNSEFPSHHLRNDAKMKTSKMKGMEVGYVAKQIRRAIERNAKETVLGGDAKMMLRMNRWFPRLLDRLIARKVRKLYADS